MKAENEYCPPSLPKLRRMKSIGEEIEIIDRLQPHPPDCLMPASGETFSMRNLHQLPTEAPTLPINRKRLKIKMPSYKYFPKDFFSFCNNSTDPRKEKSDPFCPPFTQKRNHIFLSQSPKSSSPFGTPSESLEQKFEIITPLRQSHYENPCEKDIQKNSYLFQKFTRVLRKGRVLSKVKTVDFPERKLGKYSLQNRQSQSNNISLSNFVSNELTENLKEKVDSLSTTVFESEQSKSPVILPVVRRCKLPKIQYQARNGPIHANLYRFNKSNGVDSTVDISPQSKLQLLNLQVKLPLKLKNFPLSNEDKMSAKSTSHSEVISVQLSNKKLALQISEKAKLAKCNTPINFEEENPNNLTFGQCEEVQCKLILFTTITSTTNPFIF